MPATGQEPSVVASIELPDSGRSMHTLLVLVAPRKPDSDVIIFGLEMAGSMAVPNLANTYGDTKVSSGSTGADGQSNGRA